MSVGLKTPLAIMRLVCPEARAKFKNFLKAAELHCKAGGVSLEEEGAGKRANIESSKPKSIIQSPAITILHHV